MANKKTNKQSILKDGLFNVARAAWHPSKLYRNIALSFVFVALVLVFVIFYFSYTRAVITVKAAQETIETAAVVTIDESLSLADSVRADTVGDVVRLAGRVIVVVEEGGDTFATSPATTLPAQAKGQVTLINNYGKSQPLVATTRLLSQDGVLFRLTDQVVVPAGGSVDAEVYADQPGKDGEIGPATFTIPGLWSGLQDKIYAESNAVMTGGTRTSRALSQADVDLATQELSENLKKLAEQEVKSQLRAGEEFVPGAWRQEIIETAVDSQLGAEIEQFAMTMKLRLIAVVFNEEEVLSFAQQRLKNQTPAGKELVSADFKQLKYGIQEYDLGSGTATLRVTLPGIMRITDINPLLDKARFVGMTGEEVEVYLENFEIVEDASVQFTPFWINKVPNLRDHIKIIVK